MGTLVEAIGRRGLLGKDPASIAEDRRLLSSIVPPPALPSGCHHPRREGQALHFPPGAGPTGMGVGSSRWGRPLWLLRGRPFTPTPSSPAGSSPDLISIAENDTLHSGRRRLP